jgi:hypothetical protein
MVFSISIKAQESMKIKAILYNENVPVEIVIEEGIITSINSLNEVKEVKDLLIVGPGFIDVQVNGYAGVSFTDEDLTVEGIREATEGLWREGVTTFLPTIITASGETIRNNLRTLNSALDDPQISRTIPGFFLEGPYISPAGLITPSLSAPLTGPNFRNSLLPQTITSLKQPLLRSRRGPWYLSINAARRGS